MNATDQRRKLEPEDYGRIRYALDMNYTIREVASVWNVSTKYAKRIREGHFTFASDGTVTFSTAPDHTDPLPLKMPTCSGCGMSYGLSGLESHYAIYTSGNTKELECGALIGR